MNIYIELFVSFFKIGVFTFGGGLTMLPMLEKEIIENKNWVDKDKLLDYYAIGQCTPGIIAVNVSTFIGYDQKGVLGAIISTLGMIAPSLIIILIIAFCLEPYMQYALVQSAFAGIRVGVCAILMLSIYNLWKQGVKDTFGFIGCILSFVLVSFFQVSPVYIVIFIIIIGVIKTKSEGGNKE